MASISGLPGRVHASDGSQAFLARTDFGFFCLAGARRAPGRRRPSGGPDWSWRPAGQSQRERADELIEAGASVADVARDVSVSRATVYRWKRPSKGICLMSHPLRG